MRDAKSKGSKKITRKVSSPSKKSEKSVNAKVAVKKVAKKKNGRGRFLLVTVVIVAVLYFARGYFVAAVVNGRPIFRFNLDRSLEQQIDPSTSKKAGEQVLDSMVNEKIIAAEAARNNIVISSEDVQVEIDKFDSAYQAQGGSLEDALAAEGMTLEQLEKNIKVKRQVEELLKNEIAVSDQEIQSYFDTNKDLYGADAKIEDLRDSIKEQLSQQKLIDEFSKWIEDVKNNYNILYFVNF